MSIQKSNNIDINKKISNSKLLACSQQFFQCNTLFYNRR